MQPFGCYSIHRVVMYTYRFQYFIFLFLLTLALIKPSNIFPIPVLPMVPVILCMMLVLAVHRLFYDKLTLAKILRFKLEIGLFLTYIAVSLISLAVNQSAYENFQELIHFGVVPIAVSFSALLLLILFIQPAELHLNKESKYLFWSSMAVILFFITIAIWQWVDYHQSALITHFFVAAELPAERDHYNIRSVFRVSTDFGPLMAVISVIMLCFIHQGWRRLQYHKIYLTLLCGIFVLCLFAGVISGSRNFFIGIIVGGLVLFKKSPKKLMIGGTILMLMIHVVLFSSATIRDKYNEYLPYVNKIYNEEQLEFKDFIPKLSESNMSGRFELWERAVQEVRESPIVGISNGGFKLSAQSTSLVDNTHNMLVQILVDSGVIGFVIILLLLARVYRYFDNTNKAVFWTLFTCLMFDYQVDHSLPWLICVSWFWLMVVNSQTLFFQQEKLVKLE